MNRDPWEALGLVALTAALAVLWALLWMVYR